MSKNKDWDKRVQQYKETTEQFSNKELVDKRLAYGIDLADSGLAQDLQIQEVINRSIQGR